MASDFSRLLEQSKQLTTHIVSTGLPPLERSLDQIDSQTRKLTGVNTLDKRASYLLASKGFDAERVTQTVNSINLSSTFVPSIALPDEDLEGYLTSEHEAIFTSAIDAVAQQTTSDYEDEFEAYIHSNWERARQRISTEVAGEYSVNQETASFVAKKGKAVFSTGSSRGAQKPSEVPAICQRYANAVRQINQGRIDGQYFNMLSVFKKVSQDASLHDDGRSQVSDCWDLLAFILKEDAPLLPLQFMQEYLAQDASGAPSADAIRFRRRIIEGGRRFFEAQFCQYIEQTRTGISNGLRDKIRDFSNDRSRDFVDPAVKPWAELFYLVRCGKFEEAVEFSKRNEGIIEHGFHHYLESWYQSPNRALPELKRNALLQTWNNEIRPDLIGAPTHGAPPNPYRMALYKIIGRCDLQRKTVPGNAVLPSTEDYLWFQLMLLQEAPGGKDTRQDSYTLAQLSKLLQGFGEAHFSSRGKNPVLYFMVLLLCGEFERAVNYLCHNPVFSADGAHFAIALSYYGCLRVHSSPSSLQFGGSLTRKVEGDLPGSERLHFNLVRMIQQYIYSLRLKPEEQLHYVYLLGIFGAQEGKPNSAVQREYTDLAQEFMRQIVARATLEEEDLYALVGEQTKNGWRHSPMDRLGHLIGLSTPSDIKDKILLPAAKDQQSTEEFNTAIVLYSRSGNYDAVVDILILLLSRSLLQYQNEGDAATFEAVSETLSIRQNTKDILEYYHKHNIVPSMDKVKLCMVILGCHEFMEQYRLQNWLKALIVLARDIKFIPASTEAGQLRLAYDYFSGCSVANKEVIQIIPEILVGAMTCLYQCSIAKYPEVSAEECKERSKAIIHFAGMIQFRIPSETFALLNRIDVYMN
ncbi:Nup93/Nic96-domain-containing protein [Polychytrium aggregatum]|uniref:Nup93/Nic96-domain-containing protein n=1 Tax=Polychytrium aggregatum TaxID=110093 RepID=UPI0022FEBABA|nr:Nup93/Nic96-domain-containing protein [Polychytrium aggregatum]KAI9203091.1 Nup93/Nic96-domain-containing protein [Polychytrium aggregatum]